MAYQKLLGQGTRSLFICPSDFTDIPNPADIVLNFSNPLSTQRIFRTAPSGGAKVVELDASEPTIRELGLVGGDIIYFFDNVLTLIGCATIMIPNMANDLQVTIIWDPAFSGVIDVANNQYKISIYKKPTEFPMVTLATALNAVETTFISAGDRIELLESSATFSPSAYGNPNQLSIRGAVFPVQIRRMLNSTVDKTGGATTVTSNSGWESYYLGTW